MSAIKRCAKKSSILGAAVCCLLQSVCYSRQLLQSLEVHFELGNALFVNSSDPEGRRLQTVLRGYWEGQDLTWNSGCSSVTADNFASCRDLCANTYACAAVSYCATSAPKCAGSCFLKTSTSDSFVGDGNFQSQTVTPSSTDSLRAFVYAGNDLTWQPGDCSSVTAPSAEACKQRCTGVAACKFWSWVVPGSNKCSSSCYLKYAAGAKLSNWDFISGVSGNTGGTTDNSLGGGNCLDPGATLAAHNAYRALHADTAPLQWDAELAASAQRYSDVLAQQGCRLAHSGQNGVGENLYSGWGSVGTGMDTLTCQPAVDAWYLDEIGFIDSWSNIANYMDNSQIGHLTQIIWKSTTKVGCGAAQCNRNGMPGRVVTCQYKPPGNWMNRQMWVDNLGAPKA